MKMFRSRSRKVSTFETISESRVFRTSEKATKKNKVFCHGPLTRVFQVSGRPRNQRTASSHCGVRDTVNQPNSIITSNAK